MTVEYYRGLLDQPIRIEAFRKHIHEVVKKGDTVLEVGAGLGTYAFFAADAGAARVTAVEGGSINSVASTIGRYNGYSNVEFLQGWYPTVGPEERVDVVIFEDYPPRLLGADSYRILHDLVHKALKSGGQLIPSRARYMAAPVSSPRLWKRLRRFTSEDDRAYGIDWEPMLEYMHNQPQESVLRAEDLAHEARVIREVDLASVPHAAELGGETSWEFNEPAVLHGVAYWFELDVGETWLSNAPETDPGSWGNLFLPFEKPLTVGAKDTLEVAVGPVKTRSGRPGWLKWSAVCGEDKRTGHEFKGQPASLEDVLPVESAGHLKLSADARVQARILHQIEKGASVSEILADLANGADSGKTREEARLAGENVIRDLISRSVLIKVDNGSEGP